MPNDAMKNLRAKYPQYNDIPDTTLAKMIVEKHPRYKQDFAEYLGEAQPTPQGELTVGNAVMQGIGNIPSSLKRFGEAVISPITHPIETGKGLAKIATAAANPLSPESQMTGQELGKFYAERYGGWENVKKTFAEDPIGFLSDVSTVLTGSGALAKAGGLAKTAETLSVAGRVADPIAAAGNITRNVASVVRDKIPQVSKLEEYLYANAIKPSTTLKPIERAKIVATGLREGILPTPSGLNKIQSNIESLNGEINNKIIYAAKRGMVVNTQDIVKRIDDVVDRFKNQVTPTEDLAAIQAVKEEFESLHGKVIPVEEAQKLKQGTYSLLRKKYGELKSASVEAQKALARGIKEEITAQYPEINTLNARESSLLGLEEEIQKTVGKIENKDFLGLSPQVTGVGAGVATGNIETGAFAFLAHKIINSPAMKARLALALHRVGQNRGLRGGVLPPFATATRDITNLGQ